MKQCFTNDLHINHSQALIPDRSFNPESMSEDTDTAFLLERQKREIYGTIFIRPWFDTTGE